MIETPAAAIIANDFAQIVDFFSIGTNDLVQYVLAADRTNEQLSEYFNQVHISILRIIQQVANAGIKHKIPVAICGELAGYSNLTDIFIGLGINELSVAPSSYLEIKEKVLSINYEEAIQNANSIINNEINCDFIKY
jgi:phosphotransferase system enzyme I (PtsI)